MPEATIKSSLRTSDSDLINDRDYLNRRMSGMEVEYTTFRDHHKELAEFFDPRRGRFYIEDRNRGDKRFKNIINNHGTRALRRATAGMFAGAMSPSRPWVNLQVGDKDVMRAQPVKIWLTQLRDLVMEVLHESNFYNMAPTAIRELLLFGNGCMTHEDDFDDVARFYTHTTGSYRFSVNGKARVDTLARRFQLTSYQLVHKFGYKNCSTSVKNQFDRANYHSWHTVNHMIELNPFRDADYARVSSEFLPYRSVYWEPKIREPDKPVFLRRAGYRGFPAYCPRWELAGVEDVYAVNCPGMTALGDVKDLQSKEREHAKMVAKAGTPVLQGPPSLRNHPIPNLPGGVAINSSTNAKIEPVYTVDPRTQEMMLGIDRIERRLDSAFYADLFMAITDMAGIQPKNQLQLSQINEERLLQIGPALEQVHGEWLARLVSRVIDQIFEANLMPPAPREIQGQNLGVEFVSALAMAQRTVAVGSIERTIFFAGQLTESGYDMRHKVDADAALDEYADLVGAPPRMIVPTEQANAARQEEAQQLRQQQMLEQGQQAANIAKMASDSKLEDDNVLSRAADQMQAQAS